MHNSTNNIEGVVFLPSIRSIIVNRFLRLSKYKYRLENDLLQIEHFSNETTEPPKNMAKHLNITTDNHMGSVVYTLFPKKQLEDTIILYLHGGAYVRSFSNIHWHFIRKLSLKTSSLIIAPEYPLAPKSSYQETHAMLKSLIHAKKDIFKNKNVIIMGDSAGAGLAVGLSKYIDETLCFKRVKYILISPWLDLTLNHPMILEIEPNDPILNVKGLRLAASHYAKDTMLDHPLLSPVNGNIDHILDMTIFTGTYDILHSDALALHEKFQKNNQTSHLFIYHKMIHDWPLLPMPEANQVFKQIVNMIKT
jgi:epsilon-lactone hydrolase